VQATRATTMQVEEGQELSIGPKAKDIDLVEEGMDPSTASTQLKR